MGYDLNNKNLNTTSIKIHRCSALIKYIYEKIINNSDIQRMVYYNTLMPLKNKSKDYNGYIVNQPDIGVDDVKNLIFDIPFNPEMSMETSNSIYINLTKGSFNNKTNSLYFDINVLVPNTYLRLNEGYRHTEISQMITNILDGMHVSENQEPEYYDILGGVKFDLYDYNIYRLSKTNEFLWACLSFEVETVPFSRARR